MSTSGPRWLTAEEQCTWREFLDAFQWLIAAVDGQLQRDAGMPLAYYEILVRLSEAPDRSLRMTQLAEASSSSKSRVSHAVARLEERGWIQRMDCPTDRRGQIAQLTEDGFAALSAAAPAHVEQVRRVLFDALGPEQVRQMHGITTAILANVDSSTADYADCPPADDPPAGDEQLKTASLPAS
jgi:DNA-binding MarR family transcriptional regulator